MAGDHGVEVVDRRVHVHGAHAIHVTVGHGEWLNPLLEFAGQIHQPAARRDGNYEILDQAVGVLEVRYQAAFAE